jgi:hypothetical protein
VFYRDNWEDTPLPLLVQSTRPAFCCRRQNKFSHSISIQKTTRAKKYSCTPTLQFIQQARRYGTNINDTRTTLLWQPDPKTDASGKVHFSFYNSDIKKGYVIIIQGMDSEGRLGYLYRIVK